MNTRTALLLGLLLSLTCAAGAATTTLNQLPPDLVGAMGATMAREAAADPAYAIGANGCAKLGTGKALLQGCFDKQGPRFENGGEKLGLRLVGFGRGEKLNPVHLQRMKPEANRITYRGKDVSEWWRVLPMGYEQGFTVERAPQGSGPVVIALRANAKPVVEGDSVRWGNVRYGKLVVTDAAGRKLPAHLTVDGAQLKLAFDSRDARFPVTVDPMVWIEQEVTASDGAANDQFGYSVALSADGTTALVGAPFHQVGSNPGQGAAYVFTVSGDHWTQEAELSANVLGGAGEKFGLSVALSADGSIAAVGSIATAYIFRRTAGLWNKDQTFAPDQASFNEVALSDDGNVALVQTEAAFYVFNYSSGSWSRAARLQPTTMPPTKNSVALSADGTTALALNPGGSRVFHNVNGTWTKTAYLPQSTVGALSADGLTAMVFDFDRIRVFSNSGGTWAQTSEFAQGQTVTSLALTADGTIALVGTTVSSQNSAHLYAMIDSAWTKLDDVPYSGVFFGWPQWATISRDGTTAVVGAKVFAFAPPGIAPPAITGLDNVVVIRGSGGSKVLTLSGLKTLTLTATSDNAALLPDSGITGATTCTKSGDCILAFTPVANQTGTAKVTVTLADMYGRSATGDFLFTVIPPAPPGAPTVSATTNLTVESGKSGTNTVTISGNGPLTVSATSGDTTLLPNDAITGADACTASGPCTLTLTPAAGKSGAAIVTVTATDSYGQQGQGVFLITVTAPPSGGGGGGNLGLLELLFLAPLLMARRGRDTSRAPVA